MANRGKRLKALLEGDQRTAHTTQQAFLKSEDSLSAVEEREATRRDRERQRRDELTQRTPAIGGHR